VWSDEASQNQSTLDEGFEYFEKHVRPLLTTKCFACHGGTKAGGGLSLETAAGWQKGGESGPAIVPGEPDASLLIEAINYESLEMPPADAGGKLSSEEIAVFTKWVAMGAPDPRDGSTRLGGMTREDAESWWAFQPLPPLGLGPDSTPATIATMIDQYLDREITTRHLSATPAADRRTLLRRATYDVTGLPPTQAEVDEFVNDNSPDAFARVVDRLLASPQYGVHWGRHWLDVVRYADTAGENTDRPLPHAWRYRNWVFDTFNRDLAYDQFIRMQLAGDLICAQSEGAARADGVVATGYLAIARRFGHDIDKDMYLTHEDVIDNLGKNFLGLTLGCARCHDHKYDPVSAEDYYALYGIFESTRFAFPGCEPKGQPRDMVPLLSPVEIDSLMKPWQEKVARIEAEKSRMAEAAKVASEAIRSSVESATETLVSGQVDEGGTVPFEHRVKIRRGEVLQLQVSANANHGADSTQIAWTIREVGGEGRQWSLSELVPDLMQSNPHPGEGDAQWCFLEVTAGPVFLVEQRDSIQGNSALKSWSLGDQPSVFVNSSSERVTVWTMLEAESFFVHPGPNRPVAVAWVSPIEGEVDIEGFVADAHPGALDGVSFQIDHYAASDVGQALVSLGSATVSLPDPGVPPTIPVAYAVVDGEVKNTRLHERGDPEKPGDEVTRRWLTVFGGELIPDGGESGRRELAGWIAAHPLAARVIVNRVWEWHFGRGLVGSSNDFGARGQQPTHPELLDWLAAKFVESGYSIKSLHRWIMFTAAYQRASGAPVDSDPDNRWLAHFSRRRLTAEELRDSILAASGQLDLSVGEAHPFPAESTWSFSQHAPFNAIYPTNRRSAYLMVQRQRRHPFLALFDGADPNASTPARQTTTVPTQALYFLNDPFFHEQAAAVAGALAGREGDKLRLAQVYSTLFQREPTEAERQRLAEFLREYRGTTDEAWAAVVRVLLASNEFLHVE
jgi:hypothetical protein